MAELIGGKYTPLRSVGVSGRTVAFEATDPDGRRVVLSTAPVASQADTDRYAARAQSAATLRHPAIAGIIDWGGDGDLFYAAQEWVTGADLATVMRERGRPFSPAVVAQIGATVAGALSAAHARGLVHGDLRPHDIIQVNGEDVVLAGLGLPASADAPVLPMDAPAQAAHYMSPEQARGQAASEASDIYSLGAVLYHLATGHLPFEGASGADVAAMHASAALEPPRRINSEVPAALDDVITRAMAKNPAQRYASTEELRADLGRIATGATVQMTAIEDTPVATLPPRAVKPRRTIMWLAFIAAFAAVLLGAWFLFGRGDIDVPDLSGMTQEQAQAALEAVGLALGDVTYREDYPEDVAAGLIYEQDPEPGQRAREGARVSIVIAGNELVLLPNVEGMGESEATIALRDAGFELDVVERVFDSDVEAGVVIEQNPAPGTAAPAGAPVRLIVSKGKQVISAPDVTGMSEADARTALEAAGLVVSVTYEENDSVAEGLVVSQSPAAGVSVDAGASVAIVVSSGAAAPSPVRVPGVIGQTEADAVAEIEAAGLAAQVTLVSDPLNVGRVAAQDPAMGTMAEPGSTVSIEVGQ